MEIKDSINKPYTEQQRMRFIIRNNHNLGFEIRETEVALEAWGYTEEEQQEQQRQRIDSLTLTPSDVERALLKAKGMDFDDLKAFLKESGYTDLQIKAIGVELRANNFYRGATMGEAPQQIRIVDAIGTLLGYTSDDMDYLFLNKELPAKEEEEPEEEVEE